MLKTNELLGLTKWLDKHPLFHSGDEVEEVRHKVGHVFVPHNLDVLGQEQHLSASMNHLQLENTSINTLGYGAGVKINCDPFEKFLLIMLPMTGFMDASVKDGVVHANHDIAALINTSDPLSMSWGENCNQLIIRINKQLIERTCETLLGHPIKEDVQFSSTLNMSNGFDMYQNIIHLLASNPFISESAKSFPIITKQLEQLLVSSLLLNQNNQYSQKLLNPEKVITPQYIKKSEEYMVENAAENITLQDVANHVGISLKTLHNGFQKYRNNSPKNFLKNLRLDLVNRDLKLARLENASTTVTDIALRWGFLHLSHFSESYKEKFGEHPSKTLKG
ncbi:AraC family transcriptional regulator [Polynucleobacter sp. 30F-ANTBAC]|uniref:AraC family transcriptional regulator n=1 Tax=Polynucleobacter sp. 30F-ANTBAC TaxID=2689095 RepID=UPI001C0B43FD|nr:AraC family transcriptional regulator [Polynucleobacter sp. 30F-ANTBAC]MBU3600621.1 AraC family transcriptional regulator [Polynucleobacter sp. 30F-ANTBAC]